MRSLATLGFCALLYGVITLGANPVSAVELSADDVAALKEMRTGTMTKLVIHREARPRIKATFRDQYGNPVTVADFAGKVVVLNFWATWCPPCRVEMPSFDRLAGATADSDLVVLALSIDRVEIGRIIEFFAEIGIENLRVLHDRRSAVARRAGVLGLPITIVLDREGREIGRLQGEAKWDSPETRAILTRIIEMTAPET